MYSEFITFSGRVTYEKNEILDMYRRNNKTYFQKLVKVGESYNFSDCARCNLGLSGNDFGLVRIISARVQ